MPADRASIGSASFGLSERFWSLARRLIPKPARAHPLGGGRPRVPDRRVLAAIFFVLRTGCQWKALDAAGLGSGSTAHRRFQEWVGAGLFFRLWRVAAQRYDEVRGISWRWLAVDGCLTKAPLSRSETVGRNPTDRGKQGVKRSLLVDGEGVPLAVAVGPANRNDHLLLAETLDGLVARRPSRSAPVQHLCLDLGYADAGSRHEAARRGYVAHIRGRSEEVQERRRGRKRARRWVVERTHSWLNRCRRLLVRWERKRANHAAFLHLACALICMRAAGGAAGART
ncbi:MAG TPA: IS5 family transposase [Geminicoccaceae bacterium]|nr:IS5 family transposase [Geminicoccaceae bacterium]